MLYAALIQTVTRGVLSFLKLTTVLECGRLQNYVKRWVWIINARIAGRLMCTLTVGFKKFFSFIYDLL